MLQDEFNFANCLARIRSQDPLTYEAAYAELLPHVRAYVPEILHELAKTNDAHRRGKLIELLGDAQDAAAIPALSRHLNDTDQSVRQWAGESIGRRQLWCVAGKVSGAEFQR